MKRLLFCLALALPLSATAGNLPPRAGAQPSAAHAGAAAVLGAHRAEAEAPVDIGLIALNDFHGHLLPPHAAMMAPDGRGGAVAVPAGGAGTQPACSATKTSSPIRSRSLAHASTYLRPRSPG